MKSNQFAALQAKYPLATTATDTEWDMLARMQIAGWPLPATFPTAEQFSLAALFLPANWQPVPQEATPELMTALADFGDWLRDYPLENGWYDDSPLSDEVIASAENQTAWREFLSALDAAENNLCQTIFGPGLPTIQSDIQNGDFRTEVTWPLLTVLSCLRSNHRPHRFVPTNALEPQRKGELHVAGLTLTYELPDWLAGLPLVTLDFLNYGNN